MAARYCSGCGAPLVDGARFCAGCGVGATSGAPVAAGAATTPGPGPARRVLRCCAIAFLVLIIALCAAVFVQERSGIRLLPRFGAGPGLDPERGAKLDARIREANRTLGAVQALSSTWTAAIDSATFPDFERLTKLRDDLAAAVTLARAKEQDVMSFASENADAMQGQDDWYRASLANQQALQKLETTLKGARLVVTEVHARAGWTGAGLRVAAGEVVRMWSRGLWRASPACPWVGPDGAAGVMVPGESPGWEVPLMTLLARTSREAGFPVFAGGRRAAITIATGGDLELGCADTDPANAQGGLEVLIVVLPGQ